MTNTESAAARLPQANLPVLSLAALEIVFGDIGTSPLYTFKTILSISAKMSDAHVVLGALSLVLWTLFIITTVKYVSLAIREEPNEHKNAPLTPKGREAMIRSVIEGGRFVSELRSACRNRPVACYRPEQGKMTLVRPNSGCHPHLDTCSCLKNQTENAFSLVKF